MFNRDIKRYTDSTDTKFGRYKRYVKLGMVAYAVMFGVGGAALFLYIIDGDLVMEKKKNSAKTKLSRNKKKVETKINILTITDDLNETCEFKKPEKILSKYCSSKKSEDKILPSRSYDRISRQSLKSECESQAENSKCPACLLVIQGNLQYHLQTCLKTKFGRNGALNKEETPSSTGTSNDSETEDQNENLVLHVVDKNINRNEEKQNEKSVVVDSALDLDVDFCHMCQKNISRLNSQRKLQHVNKCIDQGEEKQREQEEEKRALELAKIAVLDCPMCGKPFKTDNGRKNHLKKCALSLGVKTEQMLKLVKEQEEEHQLKLAAGILPVKSRKQTKSTSGTAGVSKQRAIKEPKNKLDEDTQIAIAISSSLTEEQNKQDKTVIDKIGMSSSVKVAGDTRKGKKKKKVQDEQPVLLMLPDDEKQKRMENKVMSVLLPQDEDEEIENTPPSLQKSVIQEKYQTDLNDAPGFWQRSQLQEIMVDKLNKKEIFYVQTLMPPVEESKVIAGSKVRRMSEIPGRRKSVKVSCTTPDKTHSEDTEDETSDIMMVSTQTAVVLAELATVDEEQENDINSPSCSGFCPEKYIKIQENTQDQLAKELKNSFLKLLEDSTCSDVEIISLDGRHDVHKTIIMCRCPELYKMAEGSLIHLEEFPSDVISSVLMYIYGGEITLTPTMLDSALELAQRLKLAELVEVYKQIKSQISMETDNQDAEDTKVSNSHAERRCSEIDSLLKEIMDDSDEDIETNTDSLDPETGHLCSGMDDLTARNDSEEKIDGHISDEDYYEIMCSQRQKIKQVSKDKKNQEGTFDTFGESECIALISEDHHKSHQVIREIDDINKDTNKIEINNRCGGNENDTCTIDNKNNRSGDNVSFNETVNVDKKEIEELNINSSQKSLKSNKSQNVSRKTSKVRTRQDCVSPDVFADVKETSLVYENEELVIFSQSESDDSLKHSVDQHINNFSKHSDDIDVGNKSSDNSDLGQNLSDDNKYENVNTKFIESEIKRTGEGDESEDDSRNTGLTENEGNVSSSIDLSEHAVIICSDDSSDSIIQTDLRMCDKPIENRTSSYHGNRNFLESTRIHPSFSSKNTNGIDEISIIKSQTSTKSVKMPLPSNRSPKTRSSTQSSSISESLDLTLNRRLDSSSNDLFASPPEHGLKSGNSNSLLKSNNSMCQYSPKNYEHDNSNGLVSENSLTNSSFPGDLSSDKSFTDNSLDKRKVDSVRKELRTSEENPDVFSVDEDIRTTGNGLSSDESKSSTSVKSRKKKTSEEGYLSLSQKSLNNNGKYKKRKHIDNRTSSDEDSDSEIISLSFKKSKLDNSLNVTDGTAGINSSNSSSVSTRLSRMGSPDKNINSPRNKTSNKHKINELEMCEIDTVNDDIDSKGPCHTGDDVEIISDNFTELSQRSISEHSQTRSPIFKVKEKKKFLFKKRKIPNIPTMEEDKESVVEEDNEIQIDNEPDKHDDVEQLNSGEDEQEGDIVEDVWEGFDDSGGGIIFGGDNDINTPVTCDIDLSVSDNTSTTPQSNTKADVTKDSNTGLYGDREKSFEDDESDKHVEEADLTEFGNDSFMWKDDNAPFECEDNITEEAVGESHEKLDSSKKSKDDFKTPSVARSCSTKQQWIPPSPFTPMPEYDKMATPILKKEVQRYGVKPVGKKRNILLLKDIYKQTHQYETDSDYEDDDELQTNKDDLSNVKTGQNKTIKSTTGACLSTGVKSTSLTRKPAVTQPDVVVEDESLSSSDDINCSQESVQSCMVEESFLHVPVDDEDIPQSQMTTETDLGKKFSDFIHSRPDIKVRILMYEPLELDWLKKEIKDSGIKCSMEKVMEFLDEKCITFTMKNRRQEKANKRGRGRGKKKVDAEKEGKK